jgi:hypothetical protein
MNRLLSGSLTRSNSPGASLVCGFPIWGRSGSRDSKIDFKFQILSWLYVVGSWAPKTVC